MSSGIANANQPAPQVPATSPWRWLLLILGFGGIFWIFSPPKRIAPNAPPPAANSHSFLFGIIAFLLVLGTFFAIQFFQAYDFGVRRANKRALAGDLDGAIDDLRKQIEDKGPTPIRLNALGVLLIQHECWAEAVATFRKTLELGELRGICLANLGLALLRDGGPEEALSVLEEALRTGPNVPVMRCVVSLHTCLALAALGRWEEAQEQFRSAEVSAEGLRKAQIAALSKTFEECRLAIKR